MVVVKDRLFESWSFTSQEPLFCLGSNLDIWRGRCPELWTEKAAPIRGSW